MSPLRRASERTFGSMRVRNYRLFITGQLVSMTGTWMQTVALGWLVLDITGSGFAVGLALAFQFLPMLLLGLWGGVIADRYDKHRTLIWTQSAMAAVAVALWLVAAGGVGSVGLIYALILLQGLATVADNPARQAFVTEMVGPELVTNAVSLNSAVFNASRILGPSLAGIIIATIGLHWAFLFNAITFTAVIAGLKAMDTAALHRDGNGAGSGVKIREGLDYVWRTRRLRYTVALVAVFSLFALNFSVVLPLLARFTFDAGAGAFGFLTSMMALGALIGALVSAGRRRPTKGLLIGSAGVFGALVLLASMAPSLPVLAVLLVPIGAASISFIACANATLQLLSDPVMRGRVMALHGLVFLGSTPIGGPLIGWISEQWGPRVGLAVGGLAAFGSAAIALAVVNRDAIEARLRVIVPHRRSVGRGIDEAMERKVG